jgi:hypothetical protein
MVRTTWHVAVPEFRRCDMADHRRLLHQQRELREWFGGPNRRICHFPIQAVLLEMEEEEEEEMDRQDQGLEQVQELEDQR